MPTIYEEDPSNLVNGIKKVEDEDDDEFAGILEETNTSPRDEQVDNLTAVNYKVSMEEYEKVGLYC